MPEPASEPKRLAAPYVAYQTFRTFLAPFKEHVIPNRIDRSLLKSFSGAVQNQLMTALRFLHLMDDSGTPTEALRSLIAAYGTDGWPAALGGILKEGYSSLFDLPLATVSPSEFNEAFKKAYPCEGETLRKGVTFFLNAGKEAGIEFSPFLTKNSKTRSGPPPRRRQRQNGNGTPKERVAAAESDARHHSYDADSDPWLSKYPTFDPSWSPEIQKSWFAGYSELMKMRQKAK